eukprot:3779772-Rhodomonas_salina.2
MLLPASYAMCGTELGYAATSLLCGDQDSQLGQEQQVPIALRASYAMSGTDLAYGATSLRAFYAMSSTGLAYGAALLRACYAMPGTDLACGPRLRSRHGERAREREENKREENNGHSSKVRSVTAEAVYKVSEGGREPGRVLRCLPTRSLVLTGAICLRAAVQY